MLGISAVVALLCIPLVTPISVWIAKKSYGKRDDRRNLLIDETF
jgi:hypothetical protein